MAQQATFTVKATLERSARYLTTENHKIDINSCVKHNNDASGLQKAENKGYFMMKSDTWTGLGCTDGTEYIWTFTEGGNKLHLTGVQAV